ncbi:MAG TPA: hypothetical protein VF743_04110 [Acidimicrobiales bacterium]
MRRTLGVLVAGAALAGVGGVAACGDDDGGGAGGDATARFCTAYAEYVASFGGDASSSRIDDAVDALRDLDPPEEVADDWDTVFGLLTGNTGSLDADEQAEVAAASERVAAFVEDECGITASATTPTAAEGPSDRSTSSTTAGTVASGPGA